ncbi:hypothetical protein [Micrococcus sp. IITD107]|uniref:hypothetical protein n=1 Tax=Micrococcus sp. IITD107 TaxID=3342790 RepID=UPI0035B93EF0
MAETITPTGRVITPGTPTQVAHPGRAMVRTAASYALAALAIVIAAIPVIQETLGPHLPEAWVAWLVGAAALLGAVHTAVTRIMALDQLQDALRKLGLGTGVETEQPIEVDQTPPPADYTTRHRAD